MDAANCPGGTALLKKIVLPVDGVTTQILEEPGLSTPYYFNKAMRRAEGEYIALLGPGDMYAPRRIERCLCELQTSGSSLVISYVDPVDARGQALSYDHPQRKSYESALFHDIAAHPSLSFASVFFDVIYCPGNLFFRRRLLSTVGEFHSYQNLFYLDYFLRSSLLEEPMLIRERLIKHRTSQGTIGSTEEHTEILKCHFERILAGKIANPLADIFTSHAFRLGQVGWSAAVAGAFDQVLEYRQTPKKLEVATNNAAAEESEKQRAFTLVSHELSLTGAPVIVLELASLLRERGASVAVISQVDGPLRQEFEKRGIGVSCADGKGFGLIDRFLQPRGRRRRWYERWLRSGEKRLRKVRDYLEVMRGSRTDGRILLLNSVASWPIAATLVLNWKGPAFWFIHESLDPEWLMPEPQVQAFRKYVSEGRLRMVYGSEATRQYWADNGFDGKVYYWSGIKTASVPTSQLYTSRKRNRERRVILNVGSVGARKGTRALIEAFSIGRTEGLIPDDVELCIIGCPEPTSGHGEARDLVKRVLQPDVRGFVRLVGNLQPGAIPSYYEEADVYVHASIFDCMPIALLTAMAYGLPIVATDVDGCKEAIVDQSSGLLVKPRRPRQMAVALGHLLNDPDKACHLGDAARRRFEEHFSIEATLEPFLSWLESWPS